MEVQSLNLCVPGGCPNRCKFCVSRMHGNVYANHIEEKAGQREMYERDFQKRLQFARDNGCNTLILTGTGEPLGNRVFLERFAAWNRDIPDPFRWMEVQTSGVYVDNECLRFLRHTLEASTISLSLANIFDDASNAELNGTPEKLRFKIKEVCSQIRKHDFNLRLALNMNSVYNERPLDDFFARATDLGANQITFKKLYASADASLPENQWVNEHGYARFDELKEYIRTHGRALEVLPYGFIRYAVRELSIVIDSDCMSTETRPVIKYLILRPDCHLYTKWDDKGSLLF